MSLNRQIMSKVTQEQKNEIIDTSDHLFESPEHAIGRLKMLISDMCI